MTGLPILGPPGSPRPCTPDLPVSARQRRATRAANLADAVPVSQVTWTSAQHIAADVPERH